MLRVSGSTVAAVVVLMAVLAACAPALDRPASPPSSAARVEGRIATPTVASGATPVTAGPSPPEAPASPRTWTAIYSAYLGPGTVGACGRSGACHADVMNDAGAAYEWLSRRGYIAGSQSALVSRTNSCLRWFGGNMPPHGTPDVEAARDLEAWVAVGAPKN